MSYSAKIFPNGICFSFSCSIQIYFQILILLVYKCSVKFKYTTCKIIFQLQMLTVLKLRAILTECGTFVCIVNVLVPPYHRLIIPRWAKCFVLLDSGIVAVLFGAFGIVQYLPTPDPARRPWHRSTAVQSAFPNMVMLTVQWWRVGSTLTEGALPPLLFLSRYIINLCSIVFRNDW